MPRKQRSSVALINAENRESRLRTINGELDLGNGITLANYTQEIAALRAKVFEHNSTTVRLDDLSRDIKRMEDELRITSEKMLMGVGLKYGKNSNEYGKAGGTLTSERKKTSKKNPAVNKVKPEIKVETQEAVLDSAIAPQSVSADTSEVLPFMLNAPSSNGATNGNGKALKV
jgi:hypothetical protein